MDIGTLGIAGVAVITVICYLIGQAVKASGLENKWIPIIVGTCGGVLGVAGMYLMADFPAQDYLTAIAENLPRFPANVVAPYIDLQLMETLIHKEKFYELCDQFVIF